MIAVLYPPKARSRITISAPTSPPACQRAPERTTARFEAFRSGKATTIDFATMSGVVQFPSFHGALAVMTAFALRDVRWLAPFAWIWCVLVNIAAVPMGGHYGTDLVVGDLLWALFGLDGVDRDQTGGPAKAHAEPVFRQPIVCRPSQARVRRRAAKRRGGIDRNA